MNEYNEIHNGNVPNNMYQVNSMIYDDFLNANYMDYRNNNIMHSNMDINNELYSPFEGYIKGNIFKNLYNKYRNYSPVQLVPRNEHEEALLNLDQMGFAMHEMNLLLDVYPNDRNAMENYIKFRNNYNILLNDYQKKYGSFNVNSEHLNTIPFGWTYEPWPFNRRDF